MMQSMSSAVAGLNSEQTAMDVIGNNIANVNTAGFKSSTVDFVTLLSQTLSAGSAPVLTGTTPVLGGTNPVQVGLGVGIGGISQNMAQGSLQQTGNPLDIAIQGNGFLTLKGAQGVVYSRNGGLEIDASGNLVQASTGAIVQGWQPAGGPTTSLTWTSSTLSNPPPQTLTALNVPQTYTPAGGAAQSLAAVAIGQNGVITATYQDASGNSTQVVVGQIGIASFANPNGLVAVGGTSYVPGPNSLPPGAAGPTFAGAGTSGAGALATGALEQSNVNISNELTNMIVAERTYQVDAKLITTSDSMLQSLIQIQ